MGPCGLMSEEGEEEEEEEYTGSAMMMFSGVLKGKSVANSRLEVIIKVKIQYSL